MVLLAFVSVGFSVAAKESGERLAVQVGLPEQHAELGDTLPIFAGFMFLATLALVVADRFTTHRPSPRRRLRRPAGDPVPPSPAGDKRSALVTVLAIIAVLIGLVATFQTYRVPETPARKPSGLGAGEQQRFRHRRGHPT